MRLDGDRVSFGVVGPEFDRLVLGSTGDLVAEGGELDVGDCILRVKVWGTLCPIYLKMFPWALRFQT